MCSRFAELCAGESSARLWTRHFLPVSLGPEVWDWAWALATWGISAAPAWATRRLHSVRGPSPWGTGRWAVPRPHCRWQSRPEPWHQH